MSALNGRVNELNRNISRASISITTSVVDKQKGHLRKSQARRVLELNHQYGTMWNPFRTRSGIGPNSAVATYAPENANLDPGPSSTAPSDALILVDFGRPDRPDLNFKVHLSDLTSTKALKDLINDALSNDCPEHYITSSVTYHPSEVRQSLGKDGPVKIPPGTESIKVKSKKPKTDQTTEQSRRLWEPSVAERTTAYYLCNAIYKSPFVSLQLDYSKHGIDEIQVSDGKDCMLAVSRGSETIWIVFRGTETAQDFVTDLSVLPRNLGGGQVHKGFYQKVENLIHYSAVKYLLDRKEFEGYCIRVTGHSLGAACAQIFTLQALLQCEQLADSERWTDTLKIGKSHSKRPKLASIAFATPFWACETLQNRVMNKKWEFLFCTVLNDGDCVPALTNAGGALIQNLESHTEVIGKGLEHLKDLKIPLVSNLASAPESAISVFNGWLKTNRGIAKIKEYKFYYALGAYEHLRHSRDGTIDVVTMYSTNSDLTKNLVADTALTAKALNAHSLESFKANLSSTSLFSKEVTRPSGSGMIVETSVLCPQVKKVEGRKTHSDDGKRLTFMSLVVQGQFVSPPLKDRCSIDGLLDADGIRHIEVADSSHFEWKICEGLKEIQHLKLNLKTPWGSAVYALDAESLKSNASMTRREVFHGDLVERIFVAAFGKSLLTDTSARTSSKVGHLLRTSLLDLEDEAIRAIGSDTEWKYSFETAFQRAGLDSNGDSEVATENARSVLEEAGKCSETICQVLGARLELTYTSRKAWKVAGSIFSGVLITAGLIVIGFFVPPLFGATISRGAAGLRLFDLRQTRTDWFQLQQSYREILKMMAANLGCNLNEIDTDKEYILEKEINRLVDDKEKSRSGQSKGSGELDAKHFFSDPHCSAPIKIQYTTKKSKKAVMARLKMVLQVYRVRKLMMDSTSISIMGPHNVGKSHFLNLLIEDSDAASGSHLDGRTTLLTSYELCENVFVLDTPGTTDPSEAARELCNFGLYSGIVLLLFRARSVDERSLDLLERAKVMKSLGASLQVYITCIDEEQDLTEEGMKRHRQDYADRLGMEGSEIKLVSFTNNSGPAGAFSRERSELLRSLGVLDGADVGEDLFNSLENCSQLSGERQRILQQTRQKVVGRVRQKMAA